MFIILSFPKCATKSTAAALHALNPELVVMPRPFIAEKKTFFACKQWSVRHHGALFTGARKLDTWVARMQSYDVVHDVPFCYAYKEAAQCYPQAKFILCIRDADEWYTSLMACSKLTHACCPQMLVDWFGTSNLTEATRERCKAVLTTHNAKIIAYFTQHYPTRLFVMTMPLDDQTYASLACFAGFDCATHDTFPVVNTQDSPMREDVIISMAEHPQFPVPTSHLVPTERRRRARRRKV